MKKWTILAVMALLACLSASCGTGVPSAQQPPSDPVASTTQTNTPVTDADKCFYGDTELFWQLPEHAFRVLETVAGEEGFAVLYEEIRPWDENAEDKYSFIMAQFFGADGNYLRTAYTGIWSQKKQTPALTRVRFSEDILYYTIHQDVHRRMDTKTGYVTSWHYGLLAEQGDATLGYSSDITEKPYTIGMRFCLSGVDGQDREIVIPEYDHNLGMALDFLISGEEHDDRPGITYTATVHLDVANKTAVVSNTKLTYTLDFNDLSYTCTHRYTRDMLEDVLSISPDGQRAVRRADSGGAGDASWSDVVVTGADGSIMLLENATPLYHAYFFDNDTVILNTIEQLRAYDLKGDVPVSRSLLDLGRVVEPDGDIRTERKVIGLCIDHQNKLILAATRPHEWDVIRVPVTLTVLNEAFTQVATIETDYAIFTYYNNWPAKCEIALNGDGTANIYWDRDHDITTPVTVDYLSAII